MFRDKTYRNLDPPRLIFARNPHYRGVNPNTGQVVSLGLANELRRCSSKKLRWSYREKFGLPEWILKWGYTLADLRPLPFHNGPHTSRVVKKVDEYFRSAGFDLMTLLVGRGAASFHDSFHSGFRYRQCLNQDVFISSLSTAEHTFHFAVGLEQELIFSGARIDEAASELVYRQYQQTMRFLRNLSNEEVASYLADLFLRRAFPLGPRLLAQDFILSTAFAQADPALVPSEEILRPYGPHSDETHLFQFADVACHMDGALVPFIRSGVNIARELLMTQQFTIEQFLMLQCPFLDYLWARFCEVRPLLSTKVADRIARRYDRAWTGFSKLADGQSSTIEPLVEKYI